MNQRHNLIVCGLAVLAFAALSAAQAAFMTRTSLDGQYGLTVNPGNSTVGLTDANLGSNTYRVASSYYDVEPVGYNMVWVQGPTSEPSYSIALASEEGNTPAWYNASLVFKFQAPTGQTFTGGTLSFDTRHIGSWNTGNLTRWRAATFASEPSYTMDGSVRTYVDFSTALSTVFFTKYNGNAGSDSEPYELLTLNLPTGVSSFYAVLGAPYVTGDNSSVRLGGVLFNNVTVPEPASLGLLALGALALARRKR